MAPPIGSFFLHMLVLLLPVLVKLKLQTDHVIHLVGHLTIR